MDRSLQFGKKLILLNDCIRIKIALSEMAPRQSLLLIGNLQSSSLSAEARDIGIFGADSYAAAQALIGALGNDPSAQDSDHGVRAAAAKAIQMITNTQ